MDSIFPFIDQQPVEETTNQVDDLPTPHEYAFDFATGDFILQDGKFIVVEGLEAVKIWIYKALITQRYRYLAYSWDYGSELENLVGSEYSNLAVQSEAKRYIEECLSINPYINGIKNLKVNFAGDTLTVEFTALTD